MKLSEINPSPHEHQASNELLDALFFSVNGQPEIMRHLGKGSKINERHLLPINQCNYEEIENYAEKRKLQKVLS